MYKLYIESRTEPKYIEFYINTQIKFLTKIKRIRKLLYNFQYKKNEDSLVLTVFFVYFYVKNVKF